MAIIQGVAADLAPVPQELGPRNEPSMEGRDSFSSMLESSSVEDSTQPSESRAQEQAVDATQQNPREVKQQERPESQGQETLQARKESNQDKLQDNSRQAKVRPDEPAKASLEQAKLNREKAMAPALANDAIRNADEPEQEPLQALAQPSTGNKTKKSSLRPEWNLEKNAPKAESSEPVQGAALEEIAQSVNLQDRQESPEISKRAHGQSRVSLDHSGLAQKRSTEAEIPVMKMEISLEDRRTPSVKEGTSEGFEGKLNASVKAGEGQGSQSSGQDSNSSQMNGETMEFGDQTIEEAPINVRGQGSFQNQMDSQNVQSNRQAAQALEQQMSRTGNADLVRNIKFIMKDNQAGEIKMVLRPESLGNVRIQLSMQENNIVGRIVVENQSVRDAFLNNMNQLNQMLKESGFEDAQIDVFVGQQDQPSQDPQDLEEEQEAWNNLRAVAALEEAVPSSSTVYEAYQGGLDLVV